MKLPRRREDVYFHELEEETLVFHRGDSQAHCLNRVAAMVFARCDGESQLGDCGLELESRLGLEAGSGEALALASLDELRDKQLVEGERLVGTTRRELLGKAAAVLPLIGSVSLPTPAQAASCVLEADCSGACGARCQAADSLGDLLPCGSAICFQFVSKAATATDCSGDVFLGPNCQPPRANYDFDCSVARTLFLSPIYACCKC